MCKKPVSNELNHNIKISFWNLHGYKSRLIGNKLRDTDFLHEIKDSHVIGLAETHVHDGIMDDLIIPGYKLLSYKNGKKNLKSKTAPGGLAIFIKESFINKFTEVKTEDENTIWIKMKKELVGYEEDIFLGTSYLSPNWNNSKLKSSNPDKTETFFDNCSSLDQRGKVLIQGDLNAHINTLSDMIIPDEFDEILGITHNPALPIRNSQDRKVADGRGKEVIDFCKSHEFNIINGRKIGDSLGQNTCFQWNGTSLVDYLISSYRMYDQIEYFQVGNFIPWISDHCPLHYSLKTKMKTSIVGREPKLKKMPEQYFLDTNCKERLRKELKSVTVTEYFHQILHKMEDPNEIAQTIMDSLKIAAKNAKLKIKKHRETFSNQPWFDFECKTLKNNLNKITSKKNLEMNS